MIRNITFFKLHSSFLFASLKSVVCPVAPGSSSKLTLQQFRMTTHISDYKTPAIINTVYMFDLQKNVVFPVFLYRKLSIKQMCMKHDMLTHTKECSKKPLNRTAVK